MAPGRDLAGGRHEGVRTIGLVRHPRRLAPTTAVAIVMFTTTLASNAPSPLYVVYQRRFGFSQATLTWIFAAYAFAVLASLVTVGRISDEVGRKRIMVPSLAVLGASAVLFAAAQGTGWLLAAR